MESIEKLIEDLALDNTNSGEHWVDVTHINNPHSFYVRPTKCRRYMSALQAYEEKILESEAQVHRTVIYKSKSLQCYVRGKILFVEKKDGKVYCDMYAIDYGFFEKCVSIKIIRKRLHPVDVQPLAIHCQLADCKPFGKNFCDYTIDCMKTFIGKNRVKMFVRGKTTNELIVELNNSESDISTLLALIGCTSLGCDSNDVSRVTSIAPIKLCVKFKDLCVSDELLVRFQSGDSLKSFYVAFPNEYKFYLNQMKELSLHSQYKQAIRSEDVKVGLPVAVHVDRHVISFTKHERAIIREITVPDTTVKVQLIDWGNTIEVPYSTLKPIGEFFLENPAIAIYCTIQETQANDYRLDKYLIQGSQFKLTIVEIGDRLDSPYVVNIVTQEKI